jgi:hypothetical protein
MSGIRGYDDPDSSSSSDDGFGFPRRSNTNGGGGAVSDDETVDPVMPFHQRRKGPSHPGLASLQPSNKKYDRLMSYRYYRLNKTSHTRDHARTHQLHRLLKNLELSFKDSKFTGKDPVLIFDFLTRMVEECDTLGMSEAQAYMALPHFLSDTARTQYRAMHTGSRSSGVTCWPEAIQYLLRTYATPSAIRNATAELRNICQSNDEDELTYGARINHAAYRCGNVYDEDERMTFFIDGLRPETRTVVARYRENEFRQDMTMERLVQHAKDSGDSFRAMAPSLRTPRPPTTRARTPPGILRTPRPTSGSPPPVVAFMGQPTPSVGTVPSVTEGTSDTPNDGEGLYALEGGEDLESIPTSDLPSTQASDTQSLEKAINAANQEQLLWLDRNGPVRKRTMPPGIPYEDGNSNRVGWLDTTRKLICYLCYERGHKASDCKCGIRDMPKVVANYQKLTADEKVSVPDTYYRSALCFIKGRPENDLVEDVKKETQSKN